jgi:hypothetical protein
MLHEFGEILATLTPLVARYDAFTRAGERLMTNCPGAESFIRSMELAALAIAANELPGRQDWLATEQSMINGGE